MDKYIYIIRHGETEYNKLQIMQGRSIDLSLNNKGKEQADSFHKMYGDIPFELVITSELKRSQESVKQFTDKLPHIIDKRITEISWGANEGKPMDKSVTLRFKKMIEEWANGNLDYSIPGGETGTSLSNRLQNFIDDLLKRDEKYILVCTHGRALKMLVTKMLNQPISDMEKYRHANTGLYLFKQEENLFTLVKENDIAHLDNTNTKPPTN